MDDKSKIQGQGGQTQNQQQPPVQNQPLQAGGVGTIIKEHEPAIVSQPDSGVSEFVKPSETEPKVYDELEKLGVKSVSETLRLDEHAQKAGIDHAGESIPVEPTGYAPITMTEAMAQQTIKNAKLTDSIKWRAALMVKFFKKMHRELLTRKS